MNADPVKQVVHISRYWNNPEIKVAVYLKGIAIEVSLEDFCKAVVAEVPNPAWTFTREKLQAKVILALETVIGKVKEASNHV